MDSDLGERRQEPSTRSNTRLQPAAAGAILTPPRLKP